MPVGGRGFQQMTVITKGPNGVTRRSACPCGSCRSSGREPNGRSRAPGCPLSGRGQRPAVDGLRRKPGLRHRRPTHSEDPSARFHVASPGYFETPGIRLEAGRFFTHWRYPRHAQGPDCQCRTRRCGISGRERRCNCGTGTSVSGVLSHCGPATSVCRVGALSGPELQFRPTARATKPRLTPHNRPATVPACWPCASILASPPQQWGRRSHRSQRVAGAHWPVHDPALLSHREQTVNAPNLIRDRTARAEASAAG